MHLRFYMVFEGMCVDEIFPKHQLLEKILNKESLTRSEHNKTAQVQPCHSQCFALEDYQQHPH